MFSYPRAHTPSVNASRRQDGVPLPRPNVVRTEGLGRDVPSCILYRAWLGQQTDQGDVIWRGYNGSKLPVSLDVSGGHQPGLLLSPGMLKHVTFRPSSGLLSKGQQSSTSHAPPSLTSATHSIGSTLLQGRLGLPLAVVPDVDRRSGGGGGFKEADCWRGTRRHGQPSYSSVPEQASNGS